MSVETILCLEATAVRGRLSGHGFIPIVDQDADVLLSSGGFWFAPRDIVEEREDFRQLIPYVILRHEDKVAVYKRTPKGGEKRLHGLLSMGLGGHISLADAVLQGDALDVKATITRAVSRELHEEARHSPVTNREVVGFLYDDRDPVSRVHVGIVELWDLSEPFAASAEPAVGECGLIRIADLPSYVDRMEGWSQLCAEFLVSR